MVKDIPSLQQICCLNHNLIFVADIKPKTIIYTVSFEQMSNNYHSLRYSKPYKVYLPASCCELKIKCNFVNAQSVVEQNFAIHWFPPSHFDAEQNGSDVQREWSAKDYISFMSEITFHEIFFI